MWFRVASPNYNGAKACRGTFLVPILMPRDCNRHLLREWHDWWKKHRQRMRLLKKRDR